MNRYRCLLILMLGVFFAIGCVSEHNKTKIANISENEKIVLQHNDTTKSIFSISILISGYLNDDAKIIIKDGHGFEKKYLIESGEVMLRIDDDWYSTECILEYYPENVSEGNLDVTYEFFEI